MHLCKSETERKRANEQIETFKKHQYRISSFKRCGVYLILGLLVMAFNKRVAFVSKIKIEENKIMCQFKRIRYSLNHVM